MKTECVTIKCNFQQEKCKQMQKKYKNEWNEPKILKNDRKAKCKIKIVPLNSISHESNFCKDEPRMYALEKRYKYIKFRALFIIIL